MVRLKGGDGSRCRCSVGRVYLKKKKIPLQFTEYTYALKCNFRWITQGE